MPVIAGRVWCCRTVVSVSKSWTSVMMINIGHNTITSPKRQSSRGSDNNMVGQSYPACWPQKLFTVGKLLKKNMYYDDWWSYFILCLYPLLSSCQLDNGNYFLKWAESIKQIEPQWSEAIIWWWSFWRIFATNPILKSMHLSFSPPVSLNWANLFSVENLVNFNISSQMQSKT